MGTRFLTAEAKGGEVTVSLPNGQRRPRTYEIHSVYVEYITVGPPTGARQIRVTAEVEGKIFAIAGGDTQPVNTTRHYMTFPDAPLQRVPNGDDIQWMPWPQVCVVPVGTTIRVRNASGVATPNDIARVSVQYDFSVGDRGTE